MYVKNESRPLRGRLYSSYVGVVLFSYNSGGVGSSGVSSSAIGYFYNSYFFNGYDGGIGSGGVGISLLVITAAGEHRYAESDSE